MKLANFLDATETILQPGQSLFVRDGLIYVARTKLAGSTELARNSGSQPAKAFDLPIARGKDLSNE